MTTSRKSFLSFAVACIVALMAATAAFASNSADTDFTFKFSGGLPQRTEWRSKTDDTNVYMSVKGVQHAFTAHVVGADNNYSTTAHDCSHGYTYSISNVGVYRMRNWVHDARRVIHMRPSMQRPIMDMNLARGANGVRIPYDEIVVL